MNRIVGQQIMFGNGDEQDSRATDESLLVTVMNRINECIGERAGGQDCADRLQRCF